MSGNLSTADKQVYMKVFNARNNTMTQKAIGTALPGMNARDLMNSVQSLLNKKLINIASQPGKDDSPNYTAVKPGTAENKTFMTPDQKVIYGVIKNYGDKGIHVAGITREIGRDTIPPNLVRSALKKMEQDKLIKTFKNINFPSKPLYILYNLKPPENLVGGIWFDDNKEYDESLVNALCQVLEHRVRKLTFPKKSDLDKSKSTLPNALNPQSKINLLPTPAQLLTFLEDAKLTTVKLRIVNIMELMRALELDGKIEIVKPTQGIDDDDQRWDSDNDRPKKRSRLDVDSDDDDETAERRDREKEKAREQAQARKDREKEKEKKRKAKEKEARAKEKEKEKAKKKKLKEKEKKKRKEKEKKAKEEAKKRKKKKGESGDSDSDSDALVDLSKAGTKQKRKRSSSTSSISSSSSKSSSSSSSSSHSDSGSDSDSDAKSSTSASSVESEDIDLRPLPHKKSANGGTSRLFEDDGRPNILDLSDTQIRYRATNRFSVPLGQTQASCGKCPQFTFCAEDGPVNPTGCNYLTDWLANVSGGWDADALKVLRPPEVENQVEENIEMDEDVGMGDTNGHDIPNGGAEYDEEF